MKYRFSSGPCLGATSRIACRTGFGSGCARFPPTSRADSWRLLGLPFENAIKAEGSKRFNLPISDALAATDQIAKQINIVRVGRVGELDTLGMYVAQAFGQRSGWSASFSSGKAETREGARIGSIMEGVEIFAQDTFLLKR